MKAILTIGFVMIFSVMAAQTPDYASYPSYDGKDLGLMYSPTVSTFKVWSPSATKMELLLYKQGIGGSPISTHEMKKGEKGLWQTSIKKDLNKLYYVFRATVDGKLMNEVPDPYAKVVGVNGKRAQVADLKTTNPNGWASDKSPVFINKTDAIIYELHIRDASIHSHSGIKNKGKYLGLTERGTKNSYGESTGLDHIKDLGVTHVHLLPFYDYFSVNEAKPDSVQYNWGYDPLNYNTPEGSYSSDPKDGTVRIREFKQVVQKFHQNGLRVVMDVVYNHTMFGATSYMNQLVPGYYYRQNAKGDFSNATACGNETASERAMMRKFMLESVLYWVKEYHVDGFRFDLMGVHDIETMNLISRELHKVKPDILLYGEGWTAGTSPLPDSTRALKANAWKLDRIAVFSDDLRDGIKGSVFENNDRGFASGKKGMEASVKFGVVAALPHDQVPYDKVNYSKAPYTKEPYQFISYCECHDNHVLWDKLKISCPDASVESRKSMHQLALSIVLTSQGIAFLHAGTEFLRSKNGVENSFESGDSINAIDWDLKTTNKDVFAYIKALVAMRKAHPAFRMTKASDIKANLRFSENVPEGIISYTIDGQAVKDSWGKILVVYNGSAEEKKLTDQGSNWKAYILNNKLRTGGQRKIMNDGIVVGPYSCSVFFE